MKKFEIESEKVLLANEKQAVEELKKTYDQALKDINKKVNDLEESVQKLIEANPDNETLLRSKIYQLNYQKALKEQIGASIGLLKGKHVKTLNDYLNKMYEDGYLTNIYNIQKYGIPVMVPINQELLIKSVTYPVENIPLSKRLYKNLDDTKRKVISEISRGINTGASVNEIARNIKSKLDVSFRKARQIAQNEGKRVSTEARIDSMRAAKKKGADIVKVWDATLDNKTRPVHAELDQQWQEIDKPFKYTSGKVFAPKQFGIAALDINCRCALLSVPRWDLEDTIQKRDNITGELIEARNYDDWKEKYHKKIDETRGKIKKKTKANLDYLKTKEYNNKFKNIVNAAAVSELRKLTKECIKENNMTENESYAFIDNISGKKIFSDKVGTLGGYVDISAINDYSDVILTHNHPYSSSFSIDDIELLLGSSKINTIVAGGHNGTIYVLSAPKSSTINLRSEYNSLYEKYEKDTHMVMNVLASKYGWKYERK